VLISMHTIMKWVSLQLCFIKN